MEWVKREGEAIIPLMRMFVFRRGWGLGMGMGWDGMVYEGKGGGVCSSLFLGGRMGCERELMDDIRGLAYGGGGGRGIFFFFFFSNLGFGIRECLSSLKRSARLKKLDYLALFPRSFLWRQLLISISILPPPQKPPTKQSAHIYTPPLTSTVS